MSRSIFFILSISACLLLSTCKSAKLSDAVAKQEKGEYYDAAQIYRKVYAKTSNKNRVLRASIAFQTGECYREINNTQRALSAYQNALRYNYPDSMSMFYAGQMLQRMGRYPDAKKQYASFLEQSPNHLLAKNGIAGCDSALKWKANPTRYQVKKMDKFGSRDGEFAPMLTGDSYDQLYFTSSRKEALGKEKSGITGLKNNDLFLVKKDGKGEWQKPELIETELNTEFDEGVSTFTADGSTMYYTYCSEDDAIARTAELYKSSRSGAQWSAGEKVQVFKDSTTMVAHPALSPDGKYLYFVSDSRGGHGGKDIWRVAVDGIGTDFPENLGSDINTPGDEMFPYVREGNVLYFSSDGHPGMGGLDIFRAVEDAKHERWTVENMKSPVNSMADDFGITFEGNEEKGYFSSNRNDGRGSDHIYSFELPIVKVMVEGWVLDKEEEIIDEASVRIVGKDGTNLRIQVRKDGTYNSEVAPGMSYVMMAGAKGYLNQKQTLEVPPEEKSQTFYVDFSLSSISKPVLIDNIFYDFDKATLRPESKTGLDELIAMLEDNPNVTIELLSHTDRKGTEAYNQNLSQRRAQSVVDYLIEHGIEKERLTAVGYGKSVPQTVNKNTAKIYDFLPEGRLLDESFILTLTPEQQEIADQINRRTEFKVLRTNYRLF
ncbi:MAG: OmpA family protein [Dysgonamonadaceae bacterium]|jgi:peptidoglycan-associated lipoprotein|nr:OmpA family protein [Dysgonamonadaceae bacterium]